jgi:hypothetical protein
MICVELQARKVAALPELARPQIMVTDGDDLFFIDSGSIYVYSLKDYKFKRKFGKKGEGPGEFKVHPLADTGMMVYPCTEYLLVNSIGKISYFTREGKFIKERKAPMFSIFMPVKHNFIASGFVTHEKDTLLCFSLYNSKLEKIKQVYLSGIPVQIGAESVLPHEPFIYRVYKDKIYIPTGKNDFVIDVFDNNGEKVHRIKKDYEKIKVDDAYKKRILDWYKNESPLKMFWEQMKNKIKFKLHFPAIKDISVDSDWIYVFTYKRKKELTECIILDLQGKEQKRVFLPLPDDLPLMLLCYSIHNNRFYTVVENENTELWELVVKEIK